jgi:hypothetical protein
MAAVEDAERRRGGYRCRTAQDEEVAYLKKFHVEMRFIEKIQHRR